MPDNKRQHYVPQSYLRDFSIDGATIGVYLIDSDKCIDEAPISRQAQKPYFYSDNLSLEKGLSEIEQLTAANRRTIIENTSKKLTLYQKEVLYQDMMLQLFRTKQMADKFEEFATAKARIIWRHSSDELIRENAENYGVKYAYPVIPSLMVLLNKLTICFNLDYKLLVNKTELPFLTSDAPVSIYNKFFEARKIHTTGLIHKGLMLFYPLTPTYAVLYYDQGVYKVKFRKRSYLDVTDDSDINNLNALTCACASQCVYYHAATTRGEYAQWIYNEIKDKREPLIEYTEIPESETSSLWIMRSHFPFLYMFLSFMKFHDKIKLKYHKH